MGIKFLSIIPIGITGPCSATRMNGRKLKCPIKSIEKMPTILDDKFYICLWNDTVMRDEQDHMPGIVTQFDCGYTCPSAITWRKVANNGPEHGLLISSLCFPGKRRVKLWRIIGAKCPIIFLWKRPIILSFLNGMSVGTLIMVTCRQTCVLAYVSSDNAGTIHGR